jgi:arylsulfatase A-like enzyme
MNFVIISLDCVRPEALSCYPDSFGFRYRVPYRAHTPHIDELASDGIVYNNAFCQAPFTPASHASLFTGKNPYQHGIRGMFNYKLNENVTTIAERLTSAGYACGGFIGAHALSSEYGLDRGFETYDEEFDTASKNWVVGNRRPCSEVTANALDWVGKKDRDYFLFVHYFDAHDGGDTPAGDQDTGAGEADEKMSGLRGLYNSYLQPIDEAIGAPIRRTYRTARNYNPNKSYGRRYHLRQVQRIDEQIGRLVDSLRARGEYEETTVVVLADHGDAFGEHGEYGHRKYLYDTTIRIPMLIKPAAETAGQHGTDDRLVRAIDVAPTLLDEASITSPELEGKSLYRPAGNSPTQRKAYAETRMEESPDRLDKLVSDLICLRGSRWKLIRDQLDGTLELYDVESDPGEQHNVVDERPQVRDDLVAELDSKLADMPDKDQNLLTESERAAVKENLQGLGYL